MKTKQEKENEQATSSGLDDPSCSACWVITVTYGRDQKPVTFGIKGHPAKWLAENGNNQDECRQQHLIFAMPISEQQLMELEENGY